MKTAVKKYVEGFHRGFAAARGRSDTLAESIDQVEDDERLTGFARGFAVGLGNVHATVAQALADEPQEYFIEPGDQ